MFEDYQICPYTGLRSFTEEESLYFKGREDDISQATNQLQRNKFLMLTGASGDGKSSLVYAGIIPNARAGFLKSKYTQWCVADFRPERSPFKNLCRALAKQLEIPNAKTVEAELQHGFSALVDLYKNSCRYNDINAVAWQQANESGRASLKRDAANLIILVDQFEEFFTNPENYHRGVPSRDSNLVLNLLLETARLALEEDLPLYIVFTMRSDYIGQCAAFRTLPEYIGFSQFFVPRLNRSQLQQVIEEPAVLNGNKIARRLTERLIQDIAEGVDQLPILQHALNQIWHAANKGADEMDLIHYAMVGGMPADLLPDDQVKQFEKWFNGLPEKIKVCYREPNLQNVLDAHASKLYESAAEGLRSRTGKEISDETAKQIIKVTFTCLTKIDQSRAVRNRMTLREIQQVLDRTDVNCEVLGQILNIFREPGNTFIRPFITEDIESGALREDDVLDITHESLIRNWELLEHWAKEEFNNYTISLDFERQLNHWVGSNKSSDFLLSMGPLNYFETWYQKVKPNAHWIARYLPEEIDSDKKLFAATVILNDGKEFLKRSAWKHVVTRSIIKYGPRRIAAVVALVTLLALSSFGISEYFERQNSSVLKKIAAESIRISADRKTALEDKSILLCENVRLGLIKIPEIAKGISDPMERINAISGIAVASIVQGWHQPEKEIFQSLYTADSLLGLFPVSLSTPRYAEVLRETNKLMVTLEFASHYNPSKKIKDLVNQNAKRTGEWVMLIADQKPAGFSDIKNFDMAIELAINARGFTPKQITELIRQLSPMEQTKTDGWIQSKFARDMLSERGMFNYAIAFNGLYQELAYLYGASGDFEKSLRCVDTLMKYNQKYHERDYSHMPDHAAHIAASFYKYNQHTSMDRFVMGYCSRKKISSNEFYRILTAYSRGSWPGAFFRLSYMKFMNRFSNLILSLGDVDQLEYFFRKYRSALKKEVPSLDERNFYMAVSYKDEAINKSILAMRQGQTDRGGVIEREYDSAFWYFDKVKPKFLEQPVQMNNNTEQFPMKYIFQYPDFYSAFVPSEPRGGYWYFSTTSFLNYIISKNLFDKVFPTDNELKYIENWLTEYRPADVWRKFVGKDSLSFTLLSSLTKHLSERSKNSTVDFSEVYLLLANNFAGRNLIDSAKLFYQKVNKVKIVDIANTNGPYLMFHVGSAVSHFARWNEFDEAYRLIQVFKKPVNRSSLYAFAATRLQRGNVNSPVVDRLIDSARKEMLRVENVGVDQQSRYLLPYALAMRMKTGDVAEAEKTIKNVDFKFFIQQVVVRSLSFHGRLYDSYQEIPKSISPSDKAAFLWNCLYGYSEGQGTPNDAWRDFTNNHRFWYRRFIFFDNENN